MERLNGMNPNGLIKIEIAAKWLEVTPKTIYNWIEDGLLEMPEKGKVRRADVERVHKQQIMVRLANAKIRALGSIGVLIVSTGSKHGLTKSGRLNFHPHEHVRHAVSRSGCRQ